MADDNKTPENNSEDTNNEQAETAVNQTQTKDKQTLIKKILIMAVAILIILLGIIVAIFLMHSTNEEAIKTTNIPVQQDIETPAQSTEATTQAVNQTPIQQDIETPVQSKDTTFDFNNLDPEKLNEQLAMLTNKSIQIQKSEELNNNITQKQKEEEATLSPQDFQNKIEELKPTIERNNEKNTPKKELEQQANQENIKIQEQENTTNENNIIQNTNNIVENSTNEKNTINNKPLPFVKLINVAKIKGKLYKKYFDKAFLVNPDILLCRDEGNNIELYYLLLDDNLRDELLNKLLKQGFTEAYILDMLEDEFNKRCKY